MKTRILIGLIGITVLLSCSSYNYYAVSNKPLDNEKYHTFAGISEGKSRNSSIYNNDIATDKIVAAGTQEMTKRGFTIKSEHPELLLRYTAVVRRGTKEIYAPVYYNPPLAFWPRMG